jgi:hypothetical protein
MEQEINEPAMSIETLDLLVDEANKNSGYVCLHATELNKAFYIVGKDKDHYYSVYMARESTRGFVKYSPSLCRIKTNGKYLKYFYVANIVPKIPIDDDELKKFKIGVLNEKRQ